MKHEDFVTYDQAVKLKEIGFDWKVRACYRRKLILDDNPHYTEPKFIHNDTMGKRWTTNYNDNRCGGGSGKYYYSAPTLSQATKWLRAKGIEVMSYYDYTTKTWIFEVCEIGDPHFEGYHSDDFGLNKPTYEQALSAGIDKALELLKGQSNGNQD